MDRCSKQEKKCFFEYVDAHVKYWTSRESASSYQESDMSLVSVAWPNSEPEATMMASLLYAHGIPFFVRDAEPGEIAPRGQNNEHNRVVLVPEEDAAFTIKLLSELVQFEGSAGDETSVGPASREQ